MKIRDILCLRKMGEESPIFRKGKIPAPLVGEGLDPPSEIQLDFGFPEGKSILPAAMWICDANPPGGSRPAPTDALRQTPKGGALVPPKPHPPSLPLSGEVAERKRGRRGSRSCYLSLSLALRRASSLITSARRRAYRAQPGKARHLARRRGSLWATPLIHHRYRGGPPSPKGRHNTTKFYHLWRIADERLRQSAKKE